MRFRKPRPSAAPRRLQPQGFALNVRCHLEDVLLPGVTKASVAERLRQRFGAAGDSLHGGRRLAGWYLQQVCVFAGRV